MKIAAAFITVLTLVHAAPSRAQGQDQLEAMLKWGTAEVIHYDVVADYSGKAFIPAYGGDPVAVKDRFEISFDLSPAKQTLIGKPVFKNFPSTVPARTFVKPCQPAPPLSGTYEHFDLVDVKPENISRLELVAKRTFPAGAIPEVSEMGTCGLSQVAAKTEATTHFMIIPPGINLAMPETAGNNITVGKDGKTLVLDDKDKGWKYTYTLRIVK